MTKGKRIILISLIIIALGLVAFVFPVKKERTKEGLVVIVDYGNSQKQAFRLSRTGSNRAWSLLQQIATLSKIELEATNDFRPKKIDGMTDGEDNKHWNLYVNGIKQESSPLETIVNSPAEVVYRFE